MNTQTKNMLKDETKAMNDFFAKMDAKIAAAQKVVTDAEIQVIISNQWNGATVTDLIIDEEFGGITATIDGAKGCDCGFIEDYTNKNTPSDTGWMKI